MKAISAKCVNNKRLQKEMTYFRLKSTNYSTMRKHNKRLVMPFKLLKQADLNIKNMLSSFLANFSSEDKETLHIKRTLQLIDHSKSQTNKYKHVHTNYNYHRNFFTQQTTTNISDNGDNNNNDKELNLNDNNNNVYDDTNDDKVNTNNIWETVINLKRNKLLMTILPINAIPYDNVNDYKKLHNESFNTIRSYTNLCNEIRNTLLPRAIDAYNAEMEGNNDVKLLSSMLRDSSNNNNNETTITNSIIIRDNDNSTLTYRSNNDNNAQGNVNKCYVHYTLLPKHQIEQAKEIAYRRCFRKTQHIYDSLSDTEDEEENTITNADEYIFIHPYSFTKCVLDLFTLLSTFFFLFISPLQIAFIHTLSSYILQSAIINAIAECIYIIDLLLSFIIAYVDNYNDKLILQTSLIAKRYICSWFVFDFIVAIPFNFYIDYYIYNHPHTSLYKETFMLYNTTSSNVKYIHLCKLLKLLKVYKIVCDNIIVLTVFDKAIHSHIGQSVLLIVTLLLFAVFLHILTCVFIFIGYSVYPSWITKLNINHMEYINVYIASFYEQTLTILGVGYGDVTLTNINERLFSLFPLIMGVLVYSWLISALSKYRSSKAITADLYKNNTKVLECLDKIRQLRMLLTEYKEIKQSFHRKALRYLKSNLEKEKFNPNAIFTSLPLKLQKELLLAMYKPVIENFIFFKYFPNDDFKMRIILSFKPTVCIRNERLVHAGDVMEEMIFVKQGKLALEVPIPQFLSQQLSQTRNFSSIAFTFKNRITTMKSMKSTNAFAIENDWVMGECQFVKVVEIRRNEHYGDVVMFLNKRSHLSVRVCSKTAELFYLSKPDAVAIALSYPDIWRKIIMNSMKNLKKINQLAKKTLEFFYQSNKVVLGKLMKQNEQYMKEIKEKEKELLMQTKIKKGKKDSSVDIMGFCKYEWSCIEEGKKMMKSCNEDVGNTNSKIYSSINNNIGSNNGVIMSDIISSCNCASSRSSISNSNSNKCDLNLSQATQRSQLLSDTSSRGLLLSTPNNNNSNHNNDMKTISNILRKITIPQQETQTTHNSPYNDYDNISLIVNKELYDGESIIHINQSQFHQSKSSLSSTLITTNNNNNHNNMHEPIITVKTHSSEHHNKNNNHNRIINLHSPRKDKTKSPKHKHNIQSKCTIFDTSFKLIVPPSGANNVNNKQGTTTNIDFVPFIKNKNSFHDANIKYVSQDSNTNNRRRSRLDIIKTNIENNCLNLNEPELFYSEKFKAMIRKGNIH